MENILIEYTVLVGVGFLMWKFAAMKANINMKFELRPEFKANRPEDDSKK